MRSNKRYLPEEIELERKVSEFKEKQSLLADCELELADIRSKLFQFEQMYIKRIGCLYVELDQLQAQFYYAESLRNPEDPDINLKFRTSKENAEKSKSEYDNKIDKSETGYTEPSNELKSLYRKLAKDFHPDLVLNEKEKERRSQIMRRVNEVYAKGDLELLGW